MTITTRFDPADFPGSPHAIELKRGVSRLRFLGPLEAAYIERNTLLVRRRVIMWLATMVLLCAVFVGRRFLESGFAPAWALVQPALTVAAIAYLFPFILRNDAPQRYLPLARWVMPAIAVITGYFGGTAVVHGSPERLVLLTLSLMGYFFFCGLLFRSALASSLVLIAAFAVAIVAAGAPAALCVKLLLVMALTLVIVAVVSRDIEIAYRRNFLEDELISQLLSSDALTGLKNRRAFDEHLLRVWQQALRDRRELAVLMIDIDHFKAYNDTCGHGGGDMTLQKVARAIEQFARRPMDLASRYGGEEFVVILYDLASRHVHDVAERMRRSVEALGLQHPGLKPGEIVTISVGGAIVEPQLRRSPLGVVQLADEALYEAKRGGRNLVRIKGANDYDGLETGIFATA